MEGKESNKSQSLLQKASNSSLIRRLSQSPEVRKAKSGDLTSSEPFPGIKLHEDKAQESSEEKLRKRTFSAPQIPVSGEENEDNRTKSNKKSMLAQITKRKSITSNSARKHLLVSRSEGSAQVIESEKIDFSKDAHIDPKVKQRELIVNEIVTTEQTYVNDLAVIKECFIIPMREQSIISKEDLQLLFGNIEVFSEINTDLLNDFKKRIDESGNNNILLGDIFLRVCKYFRLYTMYCLNQDTANSTLHRLFETNDQFAAHLREQKNNGRCRQLDLMDLLIKPMQRLCKYPLLLKEVLSFTEQNCEEYENLVKARSEISEIVNYINERKRLGENQQKIIDIQHSIESCPSLLKAPARKYIREENITTIDCTNKRRRRKIFLFNDVFVLAKFVKSKQQHEKQYTFHNLVNLKNFRIIDYGDSEQIKNAFELSHLHKETESFLICVEDGDTKRSLLKSIKTIIKQYQQQQYDAIKSNLIKENEERERNKLEIESLNLREVEPGTGANADVWTMGILLWHLYTGKPLFPGLTFEQAAVAFLQQKCTPELEDSLPSDLKGIIQDCWLPNKDARPNFSMVYDRVRNLDCKRPENPLAKILAEFEAKKQQEKQNLIKQTHKKTNYYATGTEKT